LFETGRPTLLVPYIQKTVIKLERVMVCWDGSRSAARVAGDAMPLLERAKMVELTTVTAHGKSDEIPGADIAEHLARHGVTVEVKQIVAPDAKTSDVLLSHAADTSADLLVLGGYGHSRLREFVLGGVTRSILDTMRDGTLEPISTISASRSRRIGDQRGSPRRNQSRPRGVVVGSPRFPSGTLTPKHLTLRASSLRSWITRRQVHGRDSHAARRLGAGGGWAKSAFPAQSRR
jgi:nucleotide-binding universal stress UspA family protein